MELDELYSIDGEEISMVIRQIAQIANDDNRLQAYTTFEDKNIYFSWGGVYTMNRVVITPAEASKFANWLLDQKTEIDGR